MQARPISADDAGLLGALAAGGLPTEDLGDPGRSFFAFEHEAGAVGYAGYELCGTEVLLRSVVVLPEARGRGHGRAMTETLLGAAEAAGARRAFLFSTDAAGYFARLGFVPIARTEAPASILATRQAGSMCSSAALMTRRLGAHG